MDYPIRHPEFRYKTEFQSHEPEVFLSSVLPEVCFHRPILTWLWNGLIDFALLIPYVQFDYLKSLEIEEKINKIRWCQTANGALFLLSTNDKTIKFWKVGKENGDMKF